MKNILPILSSLILLASCQTRQMDQDRDIQLLTDSTVFSNNNIYTDTAAVEKEVIKEEPAKVIYVTRVVRENPVKGTPVVKQQDAPVEIPEAATPPIVQTSNTGNDTLATAAGKEDPVVIREEKKGWNKATQDAVIGGAVGAVGGAIISKKKGLGAVIGAAVGAAGGYILGKKKDKKAKSNP